MVGTPLWLYRRAAIGARLVDALRLSRASGVAIENLAGDDVEKLAVPVQIPHPKRRGGDQNRHCAIADELAKAALGFKHAGRGIGFTETATCLRFEARKPTSAAPSGSCELLRVAA